VVAVFDERDYSTGMRGVESNTARTRAEIGNVSWRDDLLQLAKLIDTLSPDRDDPVAFCIKKNAVSHELRRLAKWRPQS
jgi:hypothetical protein